MKKSIHTTITCLAGLAALLLAASAQASSVTVYASGPRGLDHKLASAFEKATGDHVNLWASSTGKVLARLQAEHSNPHADVVILADWAAGLSLQAKGELAKYRPSDITSNLRSAFKLPSDFLPLGGDTVGIVVNKNSLPKGHMPKDWSDLTKPAYRGQVSMPSPLLSGTAADFVLGYLQQSNEGGWPFFAKIKANNTIWPGPNSAALSPVKLGSRSVVMASVGHTALRSIRKNNDLKWIFPESGSVLIPRPITILKSSDHKATAKKFVNFAMSKKGQKLVSQYLLIPARSDVSPAPVWPSLKNAKFWTVNWNKMSDNRSAELKRFKKTVIH